MIITWIMVGVVAVGAYVFSAWLFNKLGKGKLGRWFSGKPKDPDPDTDDSLDGSVMASTETDESAGDRISQELPALKTPER